MSNKAVIILIVLFVLMIGSCNCYINYGTAEDITITVTEKDRIVQGSGDSISSKYLIFTNGEVFQNTDTIWYGKFDSTDIQGRIKPGKTYKVTVCGWRIPFWSMYRNIVKVQNVSN